MARTKHPGWGKTTVDSFDVMSGNKGGSVDFPSNLAESITIG
jgi:hypothetical protein